MTRSITIHPRMRTLIPIARPLLRHPRMALAAFAALLAVTAPFAARLPIDTTLNALLRAGDAEPRGTRGAMTRYHVRDFLFVAIVPRADLLEPQTLSRIDRLESDIAVLPGVREVVSLLDVALVHNVVGPLTDLADNYRTLRRADVDTRRAYEELTESPLYRDGVVSADGRITALQIFIDPLPARADLDARLAEALPWPDSVRGAVPIALAAAPTSLHARVRALDEVVARHRGALGLHFSGAATLADALTDSVARDLLRTTLVTTALLVLVLGVRLRDARSVLIAVGGALYCALLLLGLASLSGEVLTFATLSSVPLVLALGALMNLRLLEAYAACILERGSGSLTATDTLERALALQLAPAAFGAACIMLASAVLAFCGIGAAQAFGRWMSLAVGLAFALSMTLTAVLIRVLAPRPAPHRALASAAGVPPHVTWRAALLVGLLCAASGLPRLDGEQSLAAAFRRGTPAREALELVDRRLGGSLSCDILLRFPPPPAAPADSDPLLAGIESDGASADAWFTPHKIDRIKAVHDALAALPGVGQVQSLASALRVAETINGGVEFNAYELNILYKRIPRAVRAAVVEPYVSPADDEARVALRIHDTRPGLDRHALLARVRRELEQGLGLAPDEYAITGQVADYAAGIERRPRALFESAALTLFGLVAWLLLLRRARASTAGVVGSDTLAPVLVLGLAAWLGLPLEVLTLTLTPLALAFDCDARLQASGRLGATFVILAAGAGLACAELPALARYGALLALTLLAGALLRASLSWPWRTPPVTR